MVTAYHPKTFPRSLIAKRNVVQKVCIILGMAFIVIGFTGIFAHSFMGAHLSTTHNLIHFASGMVALIVGWSDNPDSSRRFALGFGSFYLLLGIVGFITGAPGYSAIHPGTMDDNLIKIIPGVLELGTSDHIIHISIGTLFIIAAYFQHKKWAFKNAESKRLSRDI